MRRERKFLHGVASILAAGLLVGCSSSEDQPTRVRRERITLPAALDAYWPAQSEVTGSLSDLDELWTEIETGVQAGEDVTATIEVYVTASEAAADQFDDLLDLEAAIRAYGDSKGYFGRESRDTVEETYETAMDALRTAGQRLRTAWRVLAGSHSLHEAVRERDSGVLAIGDLVTSLRERLTARDALATAAILAGEDHGGLIPLSDLAGATAADQAQAYRDLAESSELKRSIRAAVPGWDAGERDATIGVMRAAVRGPIRCYPQLAAGADLLDDLADQMLAPEQDRGAVGTLSQDLRERSGGPALEVGATVVLCRTDQRTVAVLTGIAADIDLPLPAGEYHVVALAEGRLRAVATVDITTGAATPLALALPECATHQVVLEAMTSDRPLVGPGEEVEFQALAISTVGRALTFTWEVQGPGDAVIEGDGEDATFHSDTPGYYVVLLSVDDGAGNTATAQTPVEVFAGAVAVKNVTWGDGGYADEARNPGETVDVVMTLESRATETVTGLATLTGRGGARVVSTPACAFTLAPQAGVTWTATVTLPADFDERTATFDVAFTVGDRTFTDSFQTPVIFEAELIQLPSTVTSRVLPISGVIANPGLTSAWLVVDGDPDQVYEVRVEACVFTDTILLKGSGRSQRTSIQLIARSGAWQAEDKVSFTATIPPAGLRVALAWDTPQTDVDLWVTGPDGERCYFANRETALGLTLDVDDVTGWGPENITVLVPPPGEYLVQVHYYDDWDGFASVGSNCEIAIWLEEGTDNERVEYFSGYLGQTGDLWTVTTVVVGNKQEPEMRRSQVVTRQDVSSLPPK